MLSISFIIPCYNGEKFISHNIKKIIRETKKLKIDYELIIINDGSKDNTTFKVNKLKKFFKKIKFINLQKNYGKSFSVRKGLAISKFNHVILIDADLPYFPYISNIVNELKKNIDLAMVDRNDSRSILINKPLSLYQFCRKNIGKLISKIIFYILDINLGPIDTQAGLKGFKKNNQFIKNKFLSKKFFFNFELIYLYVKSKKKISTIPVRYKIEENSSIKLFSIKNVLVILDFIKVIALLKFK